MVLNYIWIAFFLISLVVGLIRLIFFGDLEIFTDMVNSTFEMAGVAVEICLGLIGVLTLWLGLMRVGEKGGAVNVLAKVVRPFFQKLFPGKIWDPGRTDGVVVKGYRPQLSTLPALSVEDIHGRCRQMAHKGKGQDSNEKKHPEEMKPDHQLHEPRRVGGKL